MSSPSHSDRTPRGIAGRFPMWWVVLLEAGLATAVISYAVRGATRPVAAVLAVILLALALVPVRGRWLVQRLGAALSLRARVRQQRARDGLAVVLGNYAVTATAGADEVAYGVARTASTAAVVIELRSDDLFNSEPAFPVGELLPLLHIEGVSLQSVRLLSYAVPAAAGSAAVSGADLAGQPALCRTVTRLLVLSVATDSAPEQLAERGGGTAGLAQLLRRCALRGCEVVEALGSQAHPADPATMSRIVEDSLGPASRLGARGSESWESVTLGASKSLSFALHGPLEDVLPRLGDASAGLPADVVVSALVLTGTATEGYRGSVLLRASIDAAAGVEIGSWRAELAGRLASAGLSATALDGEQLQALRWTMPFGVAA